MRYPEQQKAESRVRILNVASQRFRSEGTESVSVADVMKFAGMTVGGFYKHFDSKEQLLQNAIATALVSVSERITTQVAGLPRKEALRAVIAYYLSEEHVMRPDLGCALAALGTEIARMPGPLKREVSKALDAYAERLSFLMPGETSEARRAAFLILFPSMAGCVMTARAHRSRATREQVLSGARSFFTAAFCDATSEPVIGGRQ
jgi:TetR/AcrR family transcriptional repressor of nem operon